ESFAQIRDRCFDATRRGPRVDRVADFDQYARPANRETDSEYFYFDQNAFTSGIDCCGRPYRAECRCPQSEFLESLDAPRSLPGQTRFIIPPGSDCDSRSIRVVRRLLCSPGWLLILGGFLEQRDFHGG